MTVRIEVLEGNDIEQLKDLWVELREHHIAVNAPLQKAFPLPAEDIGWETQRKRYAELLEKPNSCIFLAKTETDLVGYAAVSTFEAPGWRIRGDLGGHLMTLVVSKARRSAGVGTSLLNEVEKHFSNLGVTAMTIDLVEGNDAAGRFYKRAGAVDYQRQFLMPVRDQSSKGDDQ